MAYFVPDEVTSEALVSAMKRGVRVRLILPGKISIPTSYAMHRAPAGGRYCRRAH